MSAENQKEQESRIEKAANNLKILLERQEKIIEHIKRIEGKKEEISKHLPVIIEEIKKSRGIIKSTKLKNFEDENAMFLMGPEKRTIIETEREEANRLIGKNRRLLPLIRGAYHTELYIIKHVNWIKRIFGGANKFPSKKKEDINLELDALSKASNEILRLLRELFNLEEKENLDDKNIKDELSDKYIEERIKEKWIREIVDNERDIPEYVHEQFLLCNKLKESIDAEIKIVNSVISQLKEDKSEETPLFTLKSFSVELSIDGGRLLIYVNEKFREEDFKDLKIFFGKKRAEVVGMASWHRFFYCDAPKVDKPGTVDLIIKGVKENKEVLLFKDKYTYITYYKLAIKLYTLRGGSVDSGLADSLNIGSTNGTTIVYVSRKGGCNLKFTEGMRVFFGKKEATIIEIREGGITCAIPPNKAGKVDVVVTDKDSNEVSDRLVGGFTYGPPGNVLVTGVNYSFSKEEKYKETPIVIYGKNFPPDPEVTLRGKLLDVKRPYENCLFCKSDSPFLEGKATITIKDKNAREVYNSETKITNFREV